MKHWDADYLPGTSQPIIMACPAEEACLTPFRADFWEGDATKHFSVKKGGFSEKGGGNSVNQGFGYW